MSRKINPAEVYDVRALEVPRVARSREEINLALDIGFFDSAFLKQYKPQVSKTHYAIGQLIALQSAKGEKPRLPDYLKGH